MDCLQRLAVKLAHYASEMDIAYSEDTPGEAIDASERTMPKGSPHGLVSLQTVIGDVLQLLQRMQPALRSGGHGDGVSSVGNSLVSGLASRNRPSFEGRHYPLKLFTAHLQNILEGNVLSFLYSCVYVFSHQLLPAVSPTPSIDASLVFVFGNCQELLFYEIRRLRRHRNH